MPFAYTTILNPTRTALTVADKYGTEHTIKPGRTKEIYLDENTVAMLKRSGYRIVASTSTTVNYTIQNTLSKPISFIDAQGTSQLLPPETGGTFEVSQTAVEYLRNKLGETRIAVSPIPVSGNGTPAAYTQVSSLAAMLALPRSTELLIVYRTDTNTLYYLNAGLDPAVLGNWMQTVYQSTPSASSTVVDGGFF